MSILPHVAADLGEHVSADDHCCPLITGANCTLIARWETGGIPAEPRHGSVPLHAILTSVMSHSLRRVLAVKPAGPWLVVVDGAWQVESPAGVTDTPWERSRMWLLPLLERPRPEVESEARKVLDPGDPDLAGALRAWSSTPAFHWSRTPRRIASKSVIPCVTVLLFERMESGPAGQWPALMPPSTWRISPVTNGAFSR